MMTQQSESLRSVAVRQAQVVRLSGDLTVTNAVDTIRMLHQATHALAPSATVLLDLRDLTSMAAAGARAVFGFIHDNAMRGVGCCLVVRPVGVVSQVVEFADPNVMVPRFEDLDAAIAAQVVTRRTQVS